MWQKSRYPADKALLNSENKELTYQVYLKLLETKVFKKIMEQMALKAQGKYSLLKFVKYTKKPQQWFPPIRVRTIWSDTEAEKSEAFAVQLASVFRPNDPGGEVNNDIDNIINQNLKPRFLLILASPREVNN